MKSKENKKIGKYLQLARELKKAMEHESNRGTFPKGLVRVLENRRTSRDHPNYSIIKFGQNTDKNPRDLRRLDIYQTLVKDHQLTLVRKTRRV